MGLWLVFPFAGLEMLALAAGLYVCACRGHECEVIVIDGDKVEVAWGRRRPERRWELQRSWARVVLRRYARGRRPSRLTIRSHGREVEVGARLNEEERERLARDLVLVIGYPATHYQWA